MDYGRIAGATKAVFASVGLVLVTRPQASR